MDRLRGEPGIIVVDAGRGDGDWYVRGLRDPFALVPPAEGPDADRITFLWQPYLALETTVLLRRIEAHWEVPPTVELHFSGDTLVATGTASVDWMRRARERALAAPGVGGYIDTSLRPISGVPIEELIERIGQSILFFQSGSAAMREGQEAALMDVAGLIIELTEGSRLAGTARTAVVTGHASREGDPAVNRRLRDARAAIVRDALISRGVPAEVLRVESGAGVTVGRPGEPFLDRSVTFSVIDAG